MAILSLFVLVVCVQVCFFNIHILAVSQCKLAAWCSSSVVCFMNEVTLHWAQLVLGWVTIIGRVCHLGM